MLYKASSQRENWTYPLVLISVFKEVVSVNTKTKQNTHLFESQPGIHCFIKCHIWLSKHKSTNKAVLSTRVSERIILGTEPKNTILTLVGTLHYLNPKVLISIDTYTPKDPWFKQKKTGSGGAHWRKVNNWLFPNILITV